MDHLKLHHWEEKDGEEKGENEEKEEKEIRKKEENKYDVVSVSCGLVASILKICTSESKWAFAIMTRPSCIGYQIMTHLNDNQRFAN